MSATLFKQLKTTHQVLTIEEAECLSMTEHLGLHLDKIASSNVYNDWFFTPLDDLHGYELYEFTSDTVRWFQVKGLGFAATHVLSFPRWIVASEMEHIANTFSFALPKLPTKLRLALTRIDPDEIVYAFRNEDIAATLHLPYSQTGFIDQLPPGTFDVEWLTDRSLDEIDRALNRQRQEVIFDAMVKQERPR